jgi:sugar phosphate isomerase/epimerase
VEAIKRAGYDHMEAFTTWTNCALGPERAPASEVHALLAEHGMGLSSLNGHGMTAATLAEIDACLSAILSDLRYARELGLKRLSIRGAKRDQPMDVFIQGLRAAAEAAAEIGMGLIIGNHTGNRLERPEDIAAALEGAQADNVGVLVDAGHFHSVGVDPMAAIRRFGGQLALLHIKDQVGSESVPFGTGEMDLAGIVHAANRVGYDGFVVVEMEVADAENTERYLAEAKMCLEDIMAAL